MPLPSLPNLLKQLERITNNKKPTTKKRIELSGTLLGFAKKKRYQKHEASIEQLANLIRTNKYDDSLWERITTKTAWVVLVLENPIHNTMTDHINSLLANDNVQPEDEQLAILLNEGRQIQTLDFVRQHTMYIFATNIDVEIVVIKVGYTFDLEDRLRTLTREYKAMFWLIRAIHIDARPDEEDFHDRLKARYENLIYNYEINGKKKVELYEYDESIIKYFDAYQPANMTEYHQAYRMKKLDLAIAKESTSIAKEGTATAKEVTAAAIEHGLNLKEERLLEDDRIRRIELEIKLEELRKENK